MAFLSCGGKAARTRPSGSPSAALRAASRRSRGAPLQAEADRRGRVDVGERPELDRGVCGREVQAGGRPGRCARGQLGHHLAWHSLHSRSSSPRGDQPASLYYLRAVAAVAWRKNHTFHGMWKTRPLLIGLPADPHKVWQNYRNRTARRSPLKGAQ